MSLPSVVPEVAPLSARDKVNLVEAEMRKHEPRECPVKHHFSDGVYARELFIPRDTLLTGKIHRYTQLNILSQGEMSILMDDGWTRIKASFTIVSPPGTKRLAYAHTDCVWTTIHAIAETDPEKIEELVTSKDQADYEAFLARTEVKELT